MVVLRYRGRDVTPPDVVFIRELIAAHPEASRRALSKHLCEAWNWVQPSGELRDMVCRGLMLALHRAGHIELPPVRRQPVNNVVARHRRTRIEVNTRAVQTSLRDLRPLTITQVRRSSDESLFDSLIEEHHYLGYTRPVGEHLKHLIRSRDGRPLAVFAWSSAPRHLNLRDHFIGWSPAMRRAHIHLLAYNTRFLILPWVRVPDLASHLLGQMARRISDDWQQVYDHPIHYLETFVDPARFRGTCYRAANWIVLGRTCGRGNNAPTRRPTKPVKEVLGYPLRRDFRKRLGVLP